MFFLFILSNSFISGNRERQISSQKDITRAPKVDYHFIKPKRYLHYKVKSHRTHLISDVLSNTLKNALHFRITLFLFWNFRNIMNMFYLIIFIEISVTKVISGLTTHWIKKLYLGSYYKIDGQTHLLLKWSL